MIEQLGQGHRLNHTREVRDDLLKLIDRVWKKFPRRVNGKPRHATAESSINKPKRKAEKNSASL